MSVTYQEVSLIIVKFIKYIFVTGLEFRIFGIIFIVALLSDHDI